jgi:hypothetical protein
MTNWVAMLAAAAASSWVRATMLLLMKEPSSGRYRLGCRRGWVMEVAPENDPFAADNLDEWLDQVVVIGKSLPTPALPVSRRPETSSRLSDTST